MSAKTDEFFQTMTDRVVALIEGADLTGWAKPWAAMFGGVSGLPKNASTKKHYQGMNSLWLMLTGTDKGYASPLWATYKQWETLGGQVQAGEKGTLGVKWVITYKCVECGDTKSRPMACPRSGHTSRRSMFPSTFTLFNLAQQEGYTAPAPAVVVEPTEVVTIDEAIEAFLKETGANIRHAAQDSAYFRPGTNNIVLPLRESFTSTEGYYATVLHEVTHWVGDEARLGRDQKNLFGSEKYAAEELVAEFGSVFLQAHFGVTPEPSMASASYLKGWLKALKADPKNLYKAAKAAQESTNYLLGMSAQAEAGEVAETPLAA